MNPTPQVLILGGGPAGAAAARLLAQWGLEAVVVERSPDPDPTAPSLAESLPPSARKVLAATGLLGVVEAGGFLSNSGNTALWGGEGRRDDFAGGAAGFHILRSRFDALLRGAAAEAGAEIVKGVARLPERDADGEGWRVEVALDGGKRVEVQPGRILDCTGRAGLLARRYRVLESEAPTLAVVRRYRNDGGWENVVATHALVESFGRGWAWSVPTSETERYVAVMLDPQLHAVMEGAADLSAAFEAEIANTALMHSISKPRRARRRRMGGDRVDVHVVAVRVGPRAARGRRGLVRGPDVVVRGEEGAGLGVAGCRHGQYRDPHAGVGEDRSRLLWPPGAGNVRVAAGRAGDAGGGDRVGARGRRGYGWVGNRRARHRRGRRRLLGPARPLAGRPTRGRHRRELARRSIRRSSAGRPRCPGRLPRTAAGFGTAPRRAPRYRRPAPGDREPDPPGAPRWSPRASPPACVTSATWTCSVSCTWQRGR